MMDEIYTSKQLNEQIDKEIETMNEHWSEETITTIATWADETFGTTTPEAALSRAMDEIEELTFFVTGSGPWHPEEIAEEAADVCIALYRYIYLVDKEAINKKMAVNRARKWKLDGKGNGQHERS
jgi:hypothetical protein